jgi:arylsulfatase A-like enzyme
MPKVLDAAGVSYPSEFDGRKTIPEAGKSILPLLQGDPVEKRILYFEHEGNRAIQDEKWKLTALRGKNWELYDLENDRTELNNLANQNLEIVVRLDDLWNAWAKENNVTPLPSNYRMPYMPIE